VDVRRKAVNNPKRPENVLTLELEQTENDYLIKFILNFMEACCLQEELSGIICRVLLNNIANQIRCEELKYTLKHQDFAFTKLENIRTEILFDYVEKLQLKDRVTTEFYKEIAKKHLERDRYHEAALIIHKFSFHQEFDTLKTIENLVNTSRIPAARQLCELDDEYKIHLIKLLSTNENCKIA
jgi:hypothetical protein